MREPTDPRAAGRPPTGDRTAAGADPVVARLADAGPGLAKLVAEARQTWLARGAQAGGRADGPGWRPFEDAFPTFYQFTNKPR
ncbi:MAG TPA: multiple cyclophane-containing RiPP AmcA [Rugosimonospora sp.]|nr:multiple cyclophane-containing RiPP AmcA [Rugosimonospora sp.]